MAPQSRRRQAGCLQLLSIVCCANLLVTCAPVARGEPLKASDCKHVPRPFDDSLVSAPPETAEGSARQLVQDLGKVLVLDTIWPPKSGQAVRSSFSIFNNQHESQRGIVMTPGCLSSCLRNVPTAAGDGQQQQQQQQQQQWQSLGPYHFCLDKLLASGYDASKRTVVMIPGYFSPEEAEWVREARNRWLELDKEVNVIEVDWSNSNRGTYWQAVAHTVLVARQVTIFLHYLAELSGTNLQDSSYLNQLHLIGHSLGAHIAGFVGQDLGGRLGRITGLDPAGPTFDQFRPQQRLDRNDARLVEVLHTNSGRMKYLNFLASAPLHALNTISFVKQLSSSMSDAYTGEGNTAWFGIEQQIGHVDYFANNGRLQAGCQGLLHICDHQRARDIYVDLLNYECALRRSKSTASLLSLMNGGTGDDDDNDNDHDHDNENKPEHEGAGRLNRLYAFKSPDYETFASGTNFVMSCPELMTITKHLDDAQVLKSFKNCSIPLLDFLKPVDELIEELQSDYKIDFSNDDYHLLKPHTISNDSMAPPASQTNLARRSAYFFKTSSDKGHLVGDHYLLKIYLLDEPTWDPEACKLETEVVLNDGEKIYLELSQVLHPTSSQRVLAMPFVHLDSSKAKDQFNNLMKLVKLVERADSAEDEPYEQSPEFLEVFQDLFPKTIMLSLAKPKSRSVFGTMKDVTIKMIKSNDELPDCRLTIDMIEVHPIVYGLKRNFGALYGRDLFLGAGLNKSLPLLSTADQLKRLDEPTKFITTLSADSISSFGVGLEAAVVG